ncbi:MAG: hypothetical protein JEZ09_21710 [Salinivirgaceae bacterium]|nr:hypothetical protein [Salinivirgaceae bacterium]
MNNGLIKLDDILYKGLQPWLEENNSNEKFVKLQKKIKAVTPAFEPMWQINYHRPLSAKAEYYYALITNEATQYVNNIIELINEDDYLLRQQRWYTDTMAKLQVRFNDIIELIKEHQYFVEFMDPKSQDFDINPTHKTETFVIQLLKVALVKIYLELQELFHHLGTELKINEVDIYDRFFNQALPENSFLKRIRSDAGGDIEKLFTQSDKQKSEGISLYSFTYKFSETKADKITDLYKFLKENEFIASDNPMANFKTVFSGKEIYSPVVWSGTTNEFYYFIHLVHNEYQLIEPLKRKLWKVACKCFLRGDGSQFDIKKLKEASKPEKRADLIESAVELIK